MDSTVQQHVRDHLCDFVAVKPRRVTLSWYSFASGRARADCLWRQPLYVDPVTRLLCCTDRLPEVKARRRRMQQQPVMPVDRISLADDCELRLIRGLWFEVQLAPLPAPDYRPCHKVQRRPLKPYDRRSRIVDVEVTVRRLATPPVRDLVTAAMIDAGPAFDEWAAWQDYRRRHPDRRYAVAKRVLSRRELRRHGLTNA